MSLPDARAARRPALLLFVLLLGVPLLLPFARSAELPVAIGALTGIALCLRQCSLLDQPATRALLFALGAYAGAALCSAVDAAAPMKSWTSAVASLRLPAFGLGALALADALLGAGVDGRWLAHRLAWAGALPVALWTLDALVQGVTGYSLGGTLDADRLSGIFGADDLKLGPLLPALAPLLLWPLLGAPRWQLALAWVALLVVVLLAGARAGWVSYGLISALLAWRLAGGSKRRLALWAGAALLLMAVGTISAYQVSEPFRARIDRTLAAAGGDYDFALAGRVPIWRTAVRMAVDHPINGVGVRGFRYAYPAYADPGDPWVDPVAGTGAAHAHQLVLELLTETGLVGLLLWVCAAWRLWPLARACAGDCVAQAPWLALGVLLFPLNTHLAFHSSFMGIVLAWLVTLACLQARLRTP